MIKFKKILMEAMKPDVANTIFAKFGVRNAAMLDKGKLRKYYMALVKKHHPDTGGSNEDMQWINTAYDVLSKNIANGPGVELKPEDSIVSIEFRGDYTEDILGSGQCNRDEFLKIIEKLKEEGVTFKLQPPINYNNVQDKWLVTTILIYMDAVEFYSAAPYLEPFFKH